MSSYNIAEVMPESTGTVLIATKSERAAEYAEWLDADWDVTTVTDSDELMDAVDPDVGVVLLDKVLADDDAESLLDDLRTAGIDRPIVVLTSEDDDGDTLGSRFSTQLVRPIQESTLVETVETMAERSDETVQKQEYLALAASQAAMEIELSPGETADNDAYETLTKRIEQLRSRIDVPLEQFEDEIADSLT